MTTKRRPGRPPKTAIGKGRSNVNFQIDAPLRRDLVTAAKEANRSLSAQIAWCIRYALLAQRTLGDLEEYRRRSMKAIDAQAGKSPGRFLTEEEAKNFITEERLKTEMDELRQSLAQPLTPRKADDAA